LLCVGMWKVINGLERFNLTKMCIRDIHTSCQLDLELAPCSMPETDIYEIFRNLIFCGYLKRALPMLLTGNMDRFIKRDCVDDYVGLKFVLIVKWNEDTFYIRMCSHHIQNIQWLPLLTATDGTFRRVFCAFSKSFYPHTSS
jgi:hypothetical protein